MRRLPVYLVLDVSGSMHGEKIEAVRNGMQMLVSTLRTDPYALETAYLSVIVFDADGQSADFLLSNHPSGVASGTPIVGKGDTPLAKTIFYIYTHVEIGCHHTLHIHRQVWRRG